MKLKRGGRGIRLKDALLSRRMIAAGGAVACALVAVAVINSWNPTTLQQNFGATTSVPTASGLDSALPNSKDTGQPETLGEIQTPPNPDLNGNDAHTEGSIPGVETPDQLGFNDDNFELLRSDPDKYSNSTATISGKVYEIIDQSTSSHLLLTFRINNQAIDSEESRAVIMFQEARRAKTVPPDIDVEDCISIQGRIRGGIGDTNSLGQAIRIPIIDSSGMTEIECIDSAMPALETIDSNLTQSYGGVTLIAERVQVSDGHLRIKITAQNIDGGDNVYIREKESEAEYQGETYRSLGHLASFGAYQLDSVIPPQSEITGYMFFEPVQEFTDGPFAFRIVVEKVGISASEKSVFILKV